MNIYLNGKQKRVKFLSSPHTTKGALDYTHSKIWGAGGVRYFVTFIDDRSRKVWLFLLKNKHQAFDYFKQWKELNETQIERQVKVLTTDNSDEFNNFFNNNEIIRNKTVRLTPYRNGLAERV